MSTEESVDFLDILERMRLTAETYLEHQGIDDSGRYLRTVETLREVIEAAKEDSETPSIIFISYKHRQEGEPEGCAWWKFKREQLEDRGYYFGWENSDGSETFYKEGPTPRLHTALAHLAQGWRKTR